MHITVYHAYIALYTARIYHSGRTTIPCTSAYKRAYAPLYMPTVYAVHTHKRRRTDDYARQSPKKCGYRAILYAPYMVHIPHSTTQKHKKIIP